jgi:hypothetical protein
MLFMNEEFEHSSEAVYTFYSLHAKFFYSDVSVVVETAYSDSWLAWNQVGINTKRKQHDYRAREGEEH